ncbi:ArsR/SmtB family transcription factor [Solimicrobium silvestre]|uniref:Helix-turn-helix domain n=1 Tax=Solimicrobium silvestre TaxID=2099400 RepID=A0A2S9H5N9_9BURK|nr:helix-turn-helix domain-containing protein [Solimicrobium silvestre]PRC95268.1 Helix-turn-helix domain [Solimicrobium silvestre]
MNALTTSDMQDINHVDIHLSQIAAAIAEPARAKMLCCLLDGRARTSTELAVVGEISPSTASSHLAKLKEQYLVTVLAQGKHRYYQLAGKEVADAMEALLRIAGVAQARFIPNTPTKLRNARSCYDHMAGSVAVELHDYFKNQGWLTAISDDGTNYDLHPDGIAALEHIGLDVTSVRQTRRRFACACLDWSERKPHIAGALGNALLKFMLNRAWLERELDGRALIISKEGQRQFKKLFAIDA